MSEFYDDLAGTAAELLSEMGQPITLRHASPGVRDPETGITTPGADVVQTGFGVIVEYSTFMRAGLRNEPGSLIVQGDRQLLLSPLAADGRALTPPQVNDTVLVGSTQVTITSVAPVSPAGTPVLFDCNVRGGV